MPARRTPRRWLFLAIAPAVIGCSEVYDVGSSAPHGLLPVDQRNPIVLLNDGAYDNWQGEYAVLLARGGGPKLAGIIVNQSAIWADINVNTGGWRGLVNAARDSGLPDLPDPITSIGDVLKTPADGIIESTVANRSEGALFIIDASARWSLPYRPLVVVTGGRLTDVADAYLVDPTVADRVVVVSALGQRSGTGAAMGDPNGYLDPWADTIVAARFRYVQVSTFYDQLTDLPSSRLPDLPKNSFGAWMTAKQPQLQNLLVAADQVSVAAVGISDFVTTVVRMSSGAPAAPGATHGPDLMPDPNGHVWVVTGLDATKATERFSDLLFGPSTYAP